MLERSVYSSQKFKDMSKYFVFVKINTDEQSEVARKNHVSALPTLRFMDASGKVLHTQVGAMPLDDFVQMMNDVKRKAGR